MYRYQWIALWLFGLSLLIQPAFAVAQDDDQRPLPPIPSNFDNTAVLLPNSLSSGIIDSENPTQSYIFFADANDAIEISVLRTTGTLAPRVLLFDIENTLLIEAVSQSWSGRDVLVTYTIPLEGWYTLVVTLDTPSDGEFLLRLVGNSTRIFDYIEAGTPPEVENAALVTQTVDIPDPENDGETVLVLAGENTLIIVEGATEETSIMLLDAQGLIIEANQLLEFENEQPQWVQVSTNTAVTVNIVDQDADPVAVAQAPQPILQEGGNFGITTATPSVTPTASFTPTATPTFTDTPTATPTVTNTNTPTITPTFTSSYTPTITPTPTNTSRATNTSRPSNTPRPTNTPRATATPQLIEAQLGANQGQTSAGSIQVWRFSGRSGNQITIQTVANWDTTLSLFYNGTQIAFNDDDPILSNLNSRIEVQLPQTGVYEIMVGGYNSDDGGPYTLNISGGSDSTIIQTTQCSGTQRSRLSPGDYGRVSRDDPNRLRSTASINGSAIGRVRPGIVFEVLDGPVCSDGYAWYLISYGNGIEGWTAEGDSQNYWIESVSPSTPPSSRASAPRGARVLTGGVGQTNGAAMPSGQFQVEFYCEDLGLRPAEDGTNWYCNYSNGGRAFTITNLDFDAICQATYFNASAFAIQDGNGSRPAYRWQCYGY